MTDDSLAQCVADIRRTIGDTEPRVLRTVPRQGYRLVPDAPSGLSPVPSGAEHWFVAGPATPIGAAPANSVRQRRNHSWMLTGALALVLAIGLGWAMSSKGPVSPEGGRADRCVERRLGRPACCCGCTGRSR